MQEHRRVFGVVGLDKIKAPPVPAYLALYFELKRWGTLLNDGGLLDQPDWVWDLIDLAGSTFESAYYKPESLGNEE